MTGGERRSQEEPLGRDPHGADAGAVEAAALTAERLADQLEALLDARSRAEREARRLAARAAAGDDPALAELVRRYEAQSAVLTSEIAILRASLRGAGERAERLRAAPSD